MTDMFVSDLGLVLLWIWGLCVMLVIGAGIVWLLGKLGLIDIEE